MLDEKKLIENGYRKYSSNNIDIYFNLEICEHSGNCTHGLPQVFNLKKKPWINAENSNPAEISKCIDTCPSGALKYIIK